MCVVLCLPDIVSSSTSFSSLKFSSVVLAVVLWFSQSSLYPSGSLTSWKENNTQWTLCGWNRKFFAWIQETIHRYRRDNRFVIYEMWLQCEIYCKWCWISGWKWKGHSGRKGRMPAICIHSHEGSVLSIEVVDGNFSRECYVVNKHLRCLCVCMC